MIANDLFRSTNEIFLDFETLMNNCFNKMEKYELINDLNTKERIPIYSIQSSDFNPSDKRSNVVFMLFGEHPREIIPTEEALFLAKTLCNKNDYTISTIQEILKFTKVYILPILNIKGREILDNGDLCRRTNENDVDLNRNWDSHWTSSSDQELTTPGKKPFSEWETKKLKGFLEKLKPKSFITTHSGNLGMYSPFAYKRFLMEDLTGEMANRLKNILAIIKKINKDYCNCVSGSIGNDLGYLCPGTCLDFLFENLQVDYSFAFEIYSNKYSSFYSNIINSSNLELFNYQKFLEKNSKNSLRTISSLIQMQMKTKLKPIKLSGDSDKTCFIQNSSSDLLKREECLDYFNPTNQLHIKNTLINWTNIFLEIFALIHQN